MSVGLVVVSHSEKIATGIVELASQMAGSTRIVAAGGTDDGGIGTSFDKVTRAITTADDGSGVLVLCDLGSAILTAETVLDFLDDDLRRRVLIADAPIVEGSVVAAVSAESGDDLGAVSAAAGSAAHSGVPAAGPTSPAPESRASFVPGPPAASGSAILVNRDGLHARPASELVKLAGRFDARVTVDKVDAKSLLRIMSLGLTAGSEVSIEAEGPDAAAAVDALVALVASGFGE